MTTEDLQDPLSSGGEGGLELDFEGKRQPLRCGVVLRSPKLQLIIQQRKAAAAVTADDFLPEVEPHKLQT